MPLNLSISDMPWFGQPAKIDGNDIVDGVIKGATAVMSLSKMKREREMDEVRFAQEQHEFKQKDEAFDQNKRSAALQIQGQEYQNVVLRNKATQTALQTAWETDNEEAMTKFMMLAYKMTSGNLYEDPTLQNEMSSTLSGNPRLLQNEQMMGILKMMNDGRQLFETNKQKQASVKPEIMSVPDPETGENISMVRTGPNSWSRVSEQRDSALQDKVRLAGQTAVRSAKLRGIVDPTQLELIQADAEASAVVPGGEVMEVIDPKTGQPTVRVTRGGAGGKAAADPGAVTTSTRAQVEKQLLSGAGGLEELGRGITLMRENPSAIGPTGIVLEFMETAKGILNPLSDQELPVTETRQQLELAFTQIADTLRVDSGNMSLYERLRLEKAGSVTGMWNHAGGAIRKFENLQRAVVGKQLRGYKTLKQPVPDSLLRIVEEREVLGLAQSKLLTEEEARRWWKLNQR